MQRVHHMPFGPEIGSDGIVFRLWAPTATRVDPSLEQGAPLAMSQMNNGWFAVPAAGVTAGCRYRFRIDENLIVPDPASRFQPDYVHGASQVIDPRSFRS